MPAFCYYSSFLLTAPPDPGLHQTASIPEDQLSDIVDWDNLSKDYSTDNEERFNCPFIDFEAQDSTTDDSDEELVPAKNPRKQTRKLVNYSSSSEN